MNSKFLDGYAKDFGEKFKAALEWTHSELGKKGGQLMPRLEKALRGWRKAGPNGMTWPMPEDIAHALAGMLCCMNQHDMALKLCLDFTAYTRPGESHRLAPEDVVGPVDEDFPYTSVVLGPFE